MKTVSVTFTIPVSDDIDMDTVQSRVAAVLNSYNDLATYDDLKATPVNTKKVAPRPATPEEILEIKAFHEEQYGLEGGDEVDFVDAAYISVFDNYITGCPGYAGKVIVVVYDGGLEFTDVFAYDRDDNLYKVKMEEANCGN